MVTPYLLQIRQNLRIVRLMWILGWVAVHAVVAMNHESGGMTPKSTRFQWSCFASVGAGWFFMRRSVNFCTKT
jgi:hypothetical protein